MKPNKEKENKKIILKDIINAYNSNKDIIGVYPDEDDLGREIFWIDTHDTIANYIQSKL